MGRRKCKMHCLWPARLPEKLWLSAQGQRNGIIPASCSSSIAEEGARGSKIYMWLSPKVLFCEQHHVVSWDVARQSQEIRAATYCSRLIVQLGNAQVLRFWLTPSFVVCTILNLNSIPRYASGILLGDSGSCFWQVTGDHVVWGIELGPRMYRACCSAL